MVTGIGRVSKSEVLRQLRFLPQESPRGVMVLKVQETASLKIQSENQNDREEGSQRCLCH